MKTMLEHIIRRYFNWYRRRNNISPMECSPDKWHLRALQRIGTWGYWRDFTPENKVAISRILLIPESDIRDFRNKPDYDAIIVRTWNHRFFLVQGIDLWRHLKQHNHQL